MIAYKTCPECKCTFEFKEIDIKFKSHTVYTMTPVSRQTIIKTKYFIFKKKYIESKYHKTQHKTTYSYIICPICGYENILNKNVSSECIFDKYETDIMLVNND